MASSNWPPQSQRSEPKISPVTHCEWTRTSGAPGLGSPCTSASAVSTVRPQTHTPRSNPIASNRPHLVGRRVDAIRHSAPVGAAAFALFSRTDIGGAPLDGEFLDSGHGSARAQAVDVLRVEPQLPEDLFGVLAEAGGA